MSFNQPRPDKSDSAQYRKSGRSASFNHPRQSSGAHGKGGAPAPSPSLSSASRSFKKPGNAQGSQPRVNHPSEPIIAPSAPLHNVHSGVSAQSQTRAVPSPTSRPAETTSAPPTGIQTFQKDAISQPTSMRSNSAAPTTPVKAAGDASKGFAFQFGSISPGLVNGMQIPARTSSAPPNIDEQKRDQARHDAVKSVPPVPIPPAVKQKLPRKDLGSTEHSGSTEAHSTGKPKNDTQSHLVPPTMQAQKHHVHQVPRMSMGMTFHQPQIPVQFNVPNPQIQSQGMPLTSIQMQMQIPISLPVANAPHQVQQQMFVPGLQPQQLPPQGILHQGQGLSFPQLPAHLGNLGMGIGQYPQQQGGQFGGPRKTSVKITHPDTHQEVKLDKPSDAISDGSSSSRSQPNVPQSQTLSSYPAGHQYNYYHNYGASPMYFPGSLPLPGAQITAPSQGPRFNFPISQGPQSASFLNPQANSSFPSGRNPISKQGTAERGQQEYAQMTRDEAVIAYSVAQDAVKQADGSINGNITRDSLLHSSAATIKIEMPKLSRPSGGSDSVICREGSLPKPSAESKSASLDLQSETTKHDSVQVSGISCERDESNRPAADCPSPEVSTSNNAEGGIKENDSRSNATDNISQVPQVKEELVSATSGSHSNSSLISDGVTQGAGVQAHDFSASRINEGLLKSRTDALSSRGPTTSSSELRNDNIVEGSGFVSPRISDATITVKTADPGSKEDDGPANNITEGEDQGSIQRIDATKGSFVNSRYGTESISSESSEVKEGDQESVCKVETRVQGVPEVGSEKTDEVVDKRSDDSKVSNAVNSSVKESIPGVPVPMAGPHAKAICSLTAPESGTENIVSEELAGSADNYSPAPPGKARSDEDVGVKTAEQGGPVQILSSNDKPVPELHRSKSMAARGKKKMKELLQKADAAGSTSDLYMAYKGPEEIKETIMHLESVEVSSPRTTSKPELREVVASEDDDQSKAEPDNWEDAADISTPKLESSTSEAPASHQEAGDCIGKKYSRDFLLKFADQCTSLPEDFEVTSGTAEAFTSVVNMPRSPHPSPGRPGSGHRLDRRGSTVREDDRWSKTPGPFASGQDLRLDVPFGGNVGFRPGQGANHGVLRNPRAQSPIQYAGGILPGLMQPPGSHGGMQRAGADADRWQRATGFQQKGLIPSPQTPMQMMHKAERKYEVGKATDEEQAKQRQLKAILNKLTPQNFEKLFEQVKAVQIDNAITLIGLISQIFDKALMEPTFCEMYANLCSHLSQDLPDLNEGNEKITFRRLLLNKCQEEFERGEREQEEANKVEEEGEVKQTEEQREEKRIKARRRMLGNIRLIGELYKKRMLTEKIMHECMKKLLGQYGIPDEEDLEALCKLMSTIGEMIDHSKAKVYMDAYFERMKVLSNNMTLSSRVRFMLKDSIDLRKNKWQQRRKVEGPKKIDEVHRDAAQERHAQSSRVVRTPSMNASGRRGGPQMEFAPRGNPSSSPNAQMGSFRGLSSQSRGFGAQDARFEERQPYEPRTLSIPLSQRSVGDDTITLGPQGGLGRGLSVRGQSSELRTPLSDVSRGVVDGRRPQVGLNGLSSIERANSYSSREDPMMRSAADRYTGPAMSDQLNVQCSRDVRSPRYSSDRPSTAPLSSQGNGRAITPNASEKIWPEEKLRDLSIAAIREYYSAKDEKEVALCIKDLKSPSFYPSMVSLWITDSFERKDIERDLLTNLLISLCKAQDGMLTQVQLIEGFESALTTLEDAVNDAPKAPEFLGRMFGKVITEKVVPLNEIGRILYEGGEERGQLLEAGLAADVLGCTLEAIQSDKGEVTLNEIRRSSNLRLEDFRARGPVSSRMLEKFV